MNIIRSKITKDNLILISANSLENIVKTYKIEPINENQENLHKIYLISKNNKYTFGDKDEFFKNVKVIVLKNKLTNKLSDFPKRIEEYFNEINDSSYIAMEMEINEYIQIRSDKLKNEINDIEFDIDEKDKESYKSN